MKLQTFLTAEMQVCLQVLTDDDKVVSTALFDKAQATDVAGKITALAALIPDAPNGGEVATPN